MARKCNDCNAAMRTVGGSDTNHYEDYIEYCPHCAKSVDDNGNCDCSNCRVEVKVIIVPQGHAPTFRLLNADEDRIECGVVIF